MCIVCGHIWYVRWAWYIMACMEHEEIAIACIGHHENEVIGPRQTLIYKQVPSLTRAGASRRGAPSHLPALCVGR